LFILKLIGVFAPTKKAATFGNKSNYFAGNNLYIPFNQVEEKLTFQKLTLNGEAVEKSTLCVIENPLGLSLSKLINVRF
jgi:hypothetical protein